MLKSSNIDAKVHQINIKYLKINNFLIFYFRCYIASKNFLVS
jgi:hypothetical protein